MTRSRRKHHSPSHIARYEAKMTAHAIRQKAHPQQMSYNLTPARAFFILRKRIEFLNGKIISRMDAGEHYSLYLEEREAMIWLMDKVNELAGEKIIELDELDQTEPDESSEIDNAGSHS